MLSRTKRAVLSRGIVLLLLALSWAQAFADTSKISPDLLPLLSNSNSQIPVIIQYNSPPQTCSTGLLGGLLCTAVNLLGGVVKIVFTLVNAVTGLLSPTQILNVSNQSNVSYISLDRTVGATLDYSAAAVGATQAWSYGLNGSGVGIAIIDSGIYSHADLQASSSTSSRVVYRQSFVGGTNYDDFGHGTHVAGIVAGNGKSSSGSGSFRTFRGIAPNANLLDLRVLDQNGASNDSVIIAAIEKAVQLKSKYNVRVINLSLGRPIYERCSLDPLCQAVEAAWRNGIVVVTAAGNLGRNGYGTVLSPGNSPHAITVGAMKTMGTMTTADDLIASYSSKGPTYIDQTVKPDVVAPGNLVDSLLAPNSTLSKEFPANVLPSSTYTTSTTATPPLYFRLSGTSMATPVVTGAVALMIQKNSSLTPDTIKARLMKTASKTFPVSSTATDPATAQTYTSYYDIFTIGAGYLNVNAALADQETANYTAASPAAQYNTLTNKAYVVLNPLGLWNSSQGWALNAVWGGTVVQSGGAVANSSTAWSDSSDWGTSIAWGTGTSSGTSIAWGTNGASGTSIAWGTSGNGE